MSLTSHFHHWVRPAAWFTILIALGICIALTFLSRRLADVPELSLRRLPQAEPWPQTRRNTAVDWQALQASGQSASLDKDSLSSRFRLAGTFSYGEDGANKRRAIIDDIQAGTQPILNEGEAIDGVKVVRIFRDRVILRDGVNEEQLWLSFSRGGSDAGASDSASIRDDTEGNTRWANVDQEKYGLKRVGENRWVFNREKLLSYYRELMDEPERMLQVFDSLKPLYDENYKITGYQLGIEGEAEFFRAVGFNENDIVRSVNSIPMTNRRRAEYFIHEFVNDRANAIVLDIERNGSEHKLIYQMR